MRRRSKSPEVSTIDVQGVLGTFKVPNANLTVEYLLTFASLDGDTPNGQLLNLLVPVREVFDLDDLDFDHLLQRDLDDFRVSEEMLPYLLGERSSGETFSASCASNALYKDPGLCVLRLSQTISIFSASGKCTSTIS